MCENAHFCSPCLVQYVGTFTRRQHVKCPHCRNLELVVIGNGDRRNVPASFFGPEGLSLRYILPILNSLEGHVLCRFSDAGIPRVAAVRCQGDRPEHMSSDPTPSVPEEERPVVRLPRTLRAYTLRERAAPYRIQPVRGVVTRSRRGRAVTEAMAMSDRTESPEEMADLIRAQMGVMMEEVSSENAHFYSTMIRIMLGFWADEVIERIERREQ